MSNTAFLRLMPGSRQRNIGLELDAGFELPIAPKSYAYFEIPLRGVRVEGSDSYATKVLRTEGDSSEPTPKYTTKVLRNQHVFIEAAATVEIRCPEFIEIEPNPALAEFGSFQGLYRIHPGGEKQRLGVWFSARRDVDLSTLQYLIRIYMPA